MNKRDSLPLECIVKSHIRGIMASTEEKRNLFLFASLMLASEKGGNDFWRREKAMNNNQLYIFPKAFSDSLSLPPRQISRSFRDFRFYVRKLIWQVNHSKATLRRFLSIHATFILITFIHTLTRLSLVGEYISLLQELPNENALRSLKSRLFLIP